MLGDDERKALALLAGAPEGLTEGMLQRVHNVSLATLVALIKAKLASVRAEDVKVGTSTIRVATVKITDAGRRAIEG